MKKWKIVLWCVCILLCFLWFFRYSAEGFQITTFNVQYPFKELFLVAPNIPGTDEYLNIYTDGFDADNNIIGSLYNNAYTLDEARAKCSEFGATLATLEQMKVATNLGAKWCVAGWIDNGNMYAPTQKTCPRTVTNTTPENTDYSTGSSSNLSKFVSKKPAKAFPICWGIKPTEPAVDIRDFNPVSYSMINSGLLSFVMNGDSKDLFPVKFTVEQALYALERNNYNLGAVTGENPARAFLIANIGSVNNQIYTTDPRYTEDGSNRPLDPCTILANTRTKFRQQFESLRSVFRDLSGAVISMLGAKNENAFFSAKLQGVCSKETKSTSPACLKLATLDFDLIYGTQGSDPSDTSTSRLAALEALNYFKFQREGELCTDYQNISIVESYLKCNVPPSQNIAECSYQSGSTTGSYLTMNNLDVNAQEFLKARLSEISPYFSTSDYSTVLASIVNQLSLTIRLPSLNDFNDSTANFKIVRDRIESVRSNLRVASGSS